MADEVIDRYFPKLGPCACCGSRDARHLVIDAVRDRFWAGETAEDLAVEYDLPVGAVAAAAEAGENQ